MLPASPNTWSQGPAQPEQKRLKTLTEAQNAAIACAAVDPAAALRYDPAARAITMQLVARW